MEKQRIDWIDWVKTIAIFFVMVDHSWMLPEGSKQYIEAFIMPAFLIVSGFLFKRKSVICTICSLIIPFFVFSVLSLIWMFFVFNEDGTSFFEYVRKTTIFGYAFSTGTGCFAGAWFVHVLLFIRLLLGINSVKYNYKIIGISLLIITSFISVFVRELHTFYIIFAIPAFPFIALGIFLKEINFSPSNISWKYICPMFLLAIVIIWVNGSESFIWAHYGKSYLLYFISACLITLFFAKVGSFFKSNDFVKTISSGTLMILPLHPWMFMTLIHFLPGKLYSIGYILLPIVQLIISYPVIKVILTYFPWILGKIKWQKD